MQRAGESRLQVTSQEVTKELAVTAEVRNDVLHLQIAQTGVLRARTALDTPAPGPSSKASTLGGNKEKIAYALGMKFGNAIRKSSLEVDQKLLVKGLQDALLTRRCSPSRKCRRSC